MTEPAATNIFNPPSAPPENTAPAVPRRVEGVALTPPTNLYEGSAEDRWLADRAAADRADPWRDTSKVLGRDAAGNLIQRERTPGGEGEQTTAKPHDPDVEQPARGQNLVKIGELEMSEQAWQDLAKFKAAEDVRRANIPGDPSGYRMELPKDAVLPVGADFKFIGPDDPVRGAAVRAVQEFAFKRGLSQQDFGELLSIYASADAAHQTAIATAAKREADSLGANGPIRVQAVSQYLQAHYPKAAKAFIATLCTHTQLEAWEQIIQSRLSGGGVNFSTRDNKVDDATWNKMTYTEQKAYAEAATARAQSGGHR